MANDHVTETYFGEQGAELARVTRERVHWICERATGRVLDVGCSQGIVPILLGREGLEVVGVDVDPEAIAFAEQALGREREAVGERVRFLLGELPELDLGDRPFDTLVLGEIVEHLVHPELLLELAVRHLAPDGRILLTTPFGVHEHFDHKRTFYLHSFLSLIGPLAVPCELEVEGPYIRCHARLRGESDPPYSLDRIREEVGEPALEEILERAFEEREQKLRATMAEAQAKREGHYASLQAARKELERLRERVHALEKEVERHGGAEAATGEYLAELRQRLDRLKEERDGLSEALAEARHELTVLRAEHERELRQSAEKLAEVEAEHERWLAAFESREGAVDETVAAYRVDASSPPAVERSMLEELSRLRRRLRLTSRELAFLEEGGREQAAELAAARAAREAAESAAAEERRQRESLEERFAEAQEKRQGHYRQLEVTRAALAETRRELDRVRRSLRYQVGSALADATGSPGAVLRTPMKLVRLLRRRSRGAPLPPAPSPPVVSPAKPARGEGEAPSSKTSTAGGPATVGEGAPAAASRSPAVRHGSVAVPDPPERLRDLRMAIILDEMSTSCFAPECDLVTFTPSNWREVLTRRPPHLLFVESAWQGNAGSWQYKVGHYNHPTSVGLEELVVWCRERGIPTVFWNKEDPVHFEKFTRAACYFDHVFTTDANVIDRYRALPGLVAKTVDALPFAAQPRIHNPVAAPERRPVPCFAGSYYATRHPARRRKMEMLLDAAREFGLVIFDRNFGKPGDQYLFPERFRPHVRGGLPYDEVVEAYKSFRVFLNVNSVEDSPTMLSRRVFELLASGTPVVSTGSVAISSLFGDLVASVETEEEAREALERLLAGGEAAEEVAVRGMRHVLRSHTYMHRLARIAQVAGYGDCAAEDRRVAVLLEAGSVPSLSEAAARWKRQSRPPAELVVGVREERDEAAVEELADDPEAPWEVRILPLEGEEGRVFEQLAALATTPWVAVDPGPGDLDEHHLEDLVLATSFVEADVVGRGAAGGAEAAGREHVYTSALAPRHAMVRRELIARRGWSTSVAGVEELLEDWERRGIRAFATRPVEAGETGDEDGARATRKSVAAPSSVGGS